MPRKRVIMARMVKRSEADDSFDREFWRRVGPDGRVAAMRDLVLEYCRLRGIDEPPPGSLRSVACLRRRESVERDRSPSDGGASVGKRRTPKRGKAKRTAR